MQPLLTTAAPPSVALLALLTVPALLFLTGCSPQTEADRVTGQAQIHRAAYSHKPSVYLTNWTPAPEITVLDD